MALLSASFDAISIFTSVICSFNFSRFWRSSLNKACFSFINFVVCALLFTAFSSSWSMPESSSVITSILPFMLAFDASKLSISSFKSSNATFACWYFSFSFTKSISALFFSSKKVLILFFRYSNSFCISSYEAFFWSCIAFNFWISTPNVWISRSREIKFAASCLREPPVIEPAGLITSPSSVTILYDNSVLWETSIAVSRLSTMIVVPKRFDTILSISLE